MCCIIESSTLVSFIVKTLEIGAWLKSTRVLNVQNCACHLSGGICREAVHWNRVGRETVHEGIRTKYLSALFIFNAWRIEWTNNHQPSHAIISASFDMCVDGCPPVHPKYVLHRCKRLNYHLPITVSYWNWKRARPRTLATHTHTHTHTPNAPPE